MQKIPSTNPREIELKIAGKTYKVCPELEYIERVEAVIGSAFGALIRICDGEFRIADIVVVLSLAVQDLGGPDEAAMREIINREGIRGYPSQASHLLLFAIDGGSRK